MLTLKPSDFRPANKNQVNFDHPHKTTSTDPHTKKQVMFGPHTKNKLTSIHKLAPSNFRPAHNTEVDFDPRTKASQVEYRVQNQVDFHPAKKTSFYRPDHWNQVYFDLHSNIKSILMSPGHNLGKFDLDAKNKSFLTSAENQISADPPHWN